MFQHVSTCNSNKQSVVKTTNLVKHVPHGCVQPACFEGVFAGWISAGATNTFPVLCRTEEFRQGTDRSGNSGIF